MTTFNYTASIATALSTITRFGQSLTVTRDAQGSYDPDTGADAAGTTTGTLTAAVLPVSESRSAFGDKYLAGTLARQHMRYVIAAEESFTPQTGDRLTIDSESWEVLECEALAPDGTTVLYQMVVAK